jgi:hypothetical protein
VAISFASRTVAACPGGGASRKNPTEENLMVRGLIGVLVLVAVVLVLLKVALFGGIVGLVALVLLVLLLLGRL